jgi:hypothetical protein
MVSKSNLTVISEVPSKDGKKTVKIFLNEQTNQFYKQDDDGNITPLGGGQSWERITFEIKPEDFLNWKEGNDHYGLMVLNERDYPGKYVEIINTPVYYSNGVNLFADNSGLDGDGEGLVDYTLNVSTLYIYTGRGPLQYITDLGGTDLLLSTPFKTLIPSDLQRLTTSSFYPGMSQEDSPNSDNYYAASIFTYLTFNTTNFNINMINPNWKGYVEFDYIIRDAAIL